MSDARIYDGSALPPPEGVVPYVTNHSEEQSWYHFGAALCTAVSGIFLLLRLYTKLRIARQADFTDGSIINPSVRLIDSNFVPQQLSS